MPAVSLLQVPLPLRASSALIERGGAPSACVREVPGLLGWAVHVGVRTPEHPLLTHVCATAYDHLNMDLAATRVAALYQSHPQLSSFISLAGMPGVLGPQESIERLGAWGVSRLPDPRWNPTLSPSTVYVARPIFLLHSTDAGRLPVAIVACRYEISQIGEDRIDIDVGLDAIAVHPNHRGRGLGHLVLLEASRWLGMLTRSVLFDDGAPFALRQHFHARPQDAQAYHLAQAFLSNFMYFTVTDELLENAREDRAQGLLEPGHIRAGLAAIAHLGPVEDLIRVPEEAFSYLDASAEPEPFEEIEMTYPVEEDEC